MSIQLRGPLHHFYILDFPQGLRMDTIYDLAQGWVCQYGKVLTPGFNVLWNPSALDVHKSPIEQPPLNVEQSTELRSLARDVQIVLFCVRQVRVRAPRWAPTTLREPAELFDNAPNTDFAKDFTYGFLNSRRRPRYLPGYYR
ncbi:hypothetical protein GGR51DRAFT_516823 [Nemania sp. FL0031]|nr:hypothetical protein GGR51DRAFT_516823 [Nemania sp. FL0031]